MRLRSHKAHDEPWAQSAKYAPAARTRGTISTPSTELSRWLKGRHPHCTRGPTNAPPLGARLLLEPAQVLRPAFGRNWNLAGTPHLRTTRTMSESCSAKCRCLRQSSCFTSDHGRPSSTILQDHPSEALVVPGQEPLVVSRTSSRPGLLPRDRSGARVSRETVPPARAMCPSNLDSPTVM